MQSVFKPIFFQIPAVLFKNCKFNEVKMTLNKISCQISIYYEQQNSCFLNLSFREFTAAINFPCSKSGLRIANVIFSNSQPRLGTRKINGGRKFSEIKVQRT